MKRADDSSELKPSPDGNLTEPTFRMLVSAVRDYAILMLDPSGRIISWNEGAKALKGYMAHEIIGAHFSIFYPPEAIARALPEHELIVAASEGRFEDEGWRLRKDGSRFWANVVTTALRDAAGRLTGYCKVTRDFTERRRQEEGLRHSEERFRTLIEGVKDYAIFMLDPNGFVSTWNAGAQSIKGYEAREIIGSHFSRFYPPEALKRELPRHELRVATLEGRFEDEGWRLRKDGSRFWANVVITAMRNPSGALIGFSKITRDLTERRGHEEELRASEERFRLLVEGVTEYAIVMLDRDGFVSSWNGGAERIKGYKTDEILGKHCSHFYPPEDIAANRPWQDLATAAREGRVTSEGWRVRKDGSLFWANNVITALQDSTGAPYGFANVTQDLTQRRHAEALADTAQRMHEFIAMLAHELRNPLAPIRNAVALMRRKGLNDPILESMRQTVERQSTHLARLLDELLDVNRVARGEFSIQSEPVDLADVFARAIETSRPLIDAQGHRLHVVSPPGPVHLLGDAVRLTQVMVNILNNAAKYTPAGGDIWLTCLVRDTEVEIRVRDNGRGIAQDKLEAVFNLFMQVEPNTRGALGGLGVGLALVRRVVELHAGSVQARSAGAGKGSEFIVRLPLAAGCPRTVGAAVPPTVDFVRPLRVLVVDDNEDAANTLHLLLQAMNHVVRSVYDGATALGAAEEFRPDAILLDLGMPHMSGYEVARKLKSSGAGTPLLIAVTGWGQEADKQRAREAGFDYHLVKPVREETLQSVLAAVASATSQRR